MYTEQLNDAIHMDEIVGIDRCAYGPDASITGFVLSMSVELVMLKIISDLITINGFSIVRIKDISNVSLPHKRSVFMKNALRLKGACEINKIDVDLNTMYCALRDVAHATSLFTIYTELKDLSVVHIGKVRLLSESKLVLREISPDAEWYPADDTYAIADITRIDFAGEYERALALVAGVAGDCG